MSVSLADYLAADMRVCPVNARGAPLTAHGFKDASSDPDVIKAWRARWPSCDFGWAVPVDVVVVDLDEKNGKHGVRDFRDREGCDPHDVATPHASTPSGGIHIVYRAARAYRNLAPAIGGTGIDTRTAGGYVVLPLPDNGREWLKPLIGANLLPAPAWLDCALREAKRTPLILAPRAALTPPSSHHPGAREEALEALARACDRIRTAPCGAQRTTRNNQCLYIGGLVANRYLDYAEAYEALLAAAYAMPVYRDPWRNLESLIARSLEDGMARPLVISEVRLWMREFRALLRLKQAEARHG
jgi:hypothetical protein